MTSNGRPIITRISDSKLGDVSTLGEIQGGVFVAAGHGAWGVSHGPGTGLIMSELIEGRRTSVKMEPFRL